MNCIFFNHFSILFNVKTKKTIYSFFKFLLKVRRNSFNFWDISNLFILFPLKFFFAFPTVFFAKKRYRFCIVIPLQKHKPETLSCFPTILYFCNTNTQPFVTHLILSKLLYRIMALEFRILQFHNANYPYRLQPLSIRKTEWRPIFKYLKYLCLCKSFQVESLCFILY